MTAQAQGADAAALITKWESVQALHGILRTLQGDTIAVVKALLARVQELEAKLATLLSMVEREEIEDDIVWATRAEAAEARVQELEREVAELAKGIVDIAVVARVIDGAQPLTGPQVLHVANDVRNLLAAKDT